jgi:hypothetical protein
LPVASFWLRAAILFTSNQQLETSNLFAPPL